MLTIADEEEEGCQAQPIADEGGKGGLKTPKIG